MPSVLRSVEREVDSKPAHQVYKTKIVEKTDGNEAVSKPRNLKQVQNLRERIVFGTQSIINYANEIMTLRDPDFYFSYDTTFTLGNFFLSVLLIRNITFRTKPAIPVLFLLHKNKKQK